MNKRRFLQQIVGNSYLNKCDTEFFEQILQRIVLQDNFKM